MDMEFIDGFENGDVELRLYRIGGNIKYWLRAGAAMMEFDTEGLGNLIELLEAFSEEAEKYYE